MRQYKESIDWEEVVDGLVVMDEAAKRLGVNVSILKNWRKRNADPDYVKLFYRKGKVVWFDMREFAMDVERQKELEFEKAKQISRRWNLPIKKGFSDLSIMLVLLAFGVGLIIFCSWLANKS